LGAGAHHTGVNLAGIDGESKKLGWGDGCSVGRGTPPTGTPPPPEDRSEKELLGSLLRKK